MYELINVMDDRYDFVNGICETKDNGLFEVMYHKIILNMIGPGKLLRMRYFTRFTFRKLTIPINGMIVYGLFHQYLLSTSFLVLLLSFSHKCVFKNMATLEFYNLVCFFSLLVYVHYHFSGN